MRASKTGAHGFVIEQATRLLPRWRKLR